MSDEFLLECFISEFSKSNFSDKVHFWFGHPGDKDMKASRRRVRTGLGSFGFRTLTGLGLVLLLGLPLGCPSGQVRMSNPDAESDSLSMSAGSAVEEATASKTVPGSGSEVASSQRIEDSVDSRFDKHSQQESKITGEYKATSAESVSTLDADKAPLVAPEVGAGPQIVSAEFPSTLDADKAPLAAPEVGAGPQIVSAEFPSTMDADKLPLAVPEVGSSPQVVSAEFPSTMDADKLPLAVPDVRSGPNTVSAEAVSILKSDKVSRE